MEQRPVGAIGKREHGVLDGRPDTCADLRLAPGEIEAEFLLDVVLLRMKDVVSIGVHGAIDLEGKHDRVARLLIFYTEKDTGTTEAQVSLGAIIATIEGVEAALGLQGPGESMPE